MSSSHCDDNLKIYLCGALSVELNGSRLEDVLLHHYRGALLAYLALQPGAVHKSDEVVARLWPEDETPSLNNLSVVVNATRRALRSAGDGLVTHYGTLRLEQTGLDVDVAGFDAAWAARESDPGILGLRLISVPARCSNHGSAGTIDRGSKRRECGTGGESARRTGGSSGTGFRCETSISPCTIWRCCENFGIWRQSRMAS